jgi:3-dehydroquinate dehydratase-2
VPGVTAPTGRIALLSGPNLGLLGLRQPEIYGSATLESHVERARSVAAEMGFELVHFQSDCEGALVAELGRLRHQVDGAIVNPGALTHYSYSLADAVAAFPGPVIEVHLSNPAARERFRHRSVVAAVVAGTIAGFGGLGYELSVAALVKLIAEGYSGGG